jgi:AAHS family 4-hydroxybenzoate transporter-like MFS transporter
MLVTTVAQLAAIRLFTGLGLGAAIPACVSLAVECTTAKHREVMTVAVTSGLTIGATLAGALGGRLIAHFGWQSVFGIGGMLPLLLLPLLWLGVPTGESDAMVTTGRTSPAASVSSLLEGDLKRHTALLWSFSFLVFMPLYALTFWIPTLLLSFGFDSVSVSLGSAALSGGGFIASLLLVPATAWLGVRRVLIGISCAAVLVSVALSRLTLESMQVLAALGLLGGCLVAGAIGQTALAVSLYPAGLRTAGVGWSDAVGRTGSIVGPAAFGALLSIGKTPRDVLLALCAPLGLAVLVAIAAARLHDNRADVALER